MASRFDIGIVGAGLIGSALALWLNKHSDYSVCLIEQQSALSEPEIDNQRVVALGALAHDFLDDIDVFETLGADHAHPYNAMCVWDDNSDGELNFNADALDQASLGYMVDSLMCNYRLQQALLGSGVHCYFDNTIKRFDLQSKQTALEIYTAGDTQALNCKLIVAADGARSWIRQQAKIFANFQSYDQKGIVATIETEHSHQDCAWQGFLDTGPVAVLPLANNQSSIVWSADNARAEELLSFSEKDFETSLSQALQNRLGQVSLRSKRLSFPLKSSWAERYFAKNIVLVGDAAHSIHPMAGQGANLGFKDARALGRLLISADKSTISSPRLLSKYQAQRQNDNRQTDALMTALHHAYRVDLPVFMLARGAAMNRLNASPLLRKALTAQAMGI